MVKEGSKSKKCRLDELLVELGLAAGTAEAQAFILAGEVWSGERRLEKAGDKVDPSLPIEIRSRRGKFSSRGGHKLERALEAFGISVDGRVCMDIGASTGGFTHCLLQRGAKHVLAVDVGYGLLDAPLRENPRVSNLERTNARHLIRSELEVRVALARELSLVAMDVSFISLKTVIEPLKLEFSGVKDWVLLFKPQFEVEKKHVKKGGVVTDTEVISLALQDFTGWMTAQGFVKKAGPELSPLPGKKSGNVEYLFWFTYDEV